MRGKHLRALILAAVFVSMLAICAQAKTVSAGPYRVDYDQSFDTDTDSDGLLDRTSYYLGENLVFTAWDTDGDGKKDLWLRYDDEKYLDLELADTNKDGKPDEIAEFDRAENVTYIEPANGLSGVVPKAAVALAAVLAAVAAVMLIRRNKAPKGGDGP